MCSAALRLLDSCLHVHDNHSSAEFNAVNPDYLEQSGQECSSPADGVEAVNVRL